MLLSVLSVFAIAAVPFLEILIAIPLGFVLNLPPLVTFAASLSGNIAPLFLIAATYGRLEAWLRRQLIRRHTTAASVRAEDAMPPGGGAAEPPAHDGETGDARRDAPARDSRTQTGSANHRYQRFHNLWRRYGLPGVSLASPLIGAHLTVALVLLAGTGRRQALLWISGALTLWSVIVTAAIFFGLGL
ncbi:MAG: small multi-drug export protein [Thermaerobacterales bacterium]